MGEPVLIAATHDGSLAPKIEAIKFVKEKIASSLTFQDDSISSKLSVIGVIESSNCNGKFPLANFFLRYLENPDDPGWIDQSSEELSGFPCDNNDGIMMWNRAFFIDSENEGEKNPVMLLAARIRQDVGYDLSLQFAKFVFGISSTVLYIMDEDDDVSCQL